MSISVSGNLKDIATGAIVTGSWVRFVMRGAAGNQPFVAGTALLAPAGASTWYKDFTPDVTGAISGSLYSKSEVSVGGQTGAISYGMQIFVNSGVTGPEVLVDASQNININSPNLLSVLPVVVAPTGDSTYGRLDGTNSPFVTLSAKNFQQARYADQFAGADIGAKINAAYADLPASGGVIYVPQQSGGSAYSFTTPITFTTSGKYVLLGGIGCGGDNGSSVLGGVALNYTATSGTAITMDYVPLARSANSAVHGLSNIVLINTQTQSKGGPVSNTAIGLSCGSTNQGCYEATMQNITIQGFNIGWSNLNDKAVDIVWINPQFFYNGTAVLLSSPTGIGMFGGTFAGNGKSFKTNASGSTPEVQIFGTQFFNNTDLIIDATATTGTNTAIFDCYSPHFENSGVDSANYVSGNVNLHLFGGLVEDDNPTGTINWFFSLSGSNFTSYGVEYACNRACTNLLIANSPLRGVLGGHDRSNGHFTNYIGGANASFISNQMSPGPSSVAAIPTTFEYIKSPTVEVGTGSGLIIDEDGAPVGVAGKAVFYANSGTHRVLVNSNNGSFDNVVTAGSTDTLTNKTLTNPALTTPTTYNSIATVSGGIPAEYATVDLTAQGAAISATTLYAVPASGAGMYRISYVASITRAGSVSSTLGGTNGFQITYTDANDSVAKTSLAGPTSAANTTATPISGSIIVNAKASTNIQYLIGYTDGGGTTMQYNLHVKCEAL